MLHNNASEANKYRIVKHEDLLCEKTGKVEYFQETYIEFEEKIQGSVQVSYVKRYCPGKEQLYSSIFRRQVYRRCASEQSSRSNFIFWDNKLDIS